MEEKSYQISSKGVIEYNGNYLLRYNNRNEYELLGGRLEKNEQPECAVIREIHEESGIDAAVTRPMTPWLYKIGNIRTVLIAPFLCECRFVPDVLYDKDGGELHWVSKDDIEALPMPNGYKDTILGRPPAKSYSEIQLIGSALERALSFRHPEHKVQIDFVASDMVDHLSRPDRSDEAIHSVIASEFKSFDEVVKRYLRESNRDDTPYRILSSRVDGDFAVFTVSAPIF